MDQFKRISELKESRGIAAAKYMDAREKSDAARKAAVAAYSEYESAETEYRNAVSIAFGLHIFVTPP